MISRLVLRCFTITLGAASIAWAVLTFPPFIRAVPLEVVSARILRNEPFRLASLLSLTPALDQVEQQPRCQSSALRSSAIIRLRIAEYTFSQGQGTQIDQRFAELQRAIRKALECSPSDSFLWLSLFWEEVNSVGFKPEHFEFLRMSYKMGPNEGWIIERRSHLVLAMYAFLPSDLASLALDEFPKLLQPQFVRTAAEIFAGPGWPIRSILLERLAKTPEPQRRVFSNILQAKGIDVEVPGIVRKQGPWL